MKIFNRCEIPVDTAHHFAIITATMDGVFTVEQAAKRLGLTQAGVYLAIKEGRLDYVLLLNRLGVPKDAVQQFLAARKVRTNSRRKAA